MTDSTVPEATTTDQPELALAATLTEMSQLLEDAELATEILGIDGYSDEVLEQPQRTLRRLRDWLRLRVPAGSAARIEDCADPLGLKNLNMARAELYLSIADDDSPLAELDAIAASISAICPQLVLYEGSDIESVAKALCYLSGQLNHAVREVHKWRLDLQALALVVYKKDLGALRDEPRLLKHAVDMRQALRRTY